MSGVSGVLPRFGINDNVYLNLSRSQARLQTDVARLSSGLRINTAADDPAGLAIAEGLRAQVNGYDQASSNVQTANNALTVADGALQTISDILQRLRNLTVEANNDILSASDRSNIQTESVQLQAEINTIAQTTNFNGMQLLNAKPFQHTPLTIPDATFATTTGSTPTGPAWNMGPSNAFGHQFTWTAAAAAGSFNIQPIPSGAGQVAGIQGTAGAVFQNVNGFLPSSTYSLTLNVLQAYNGSGGQNIRVFVDATQVGSFTPVPAVAGNPDWQTVTTSNFMPGAGTHTISFQGNNGNNSWLLFDNVQLNEVSGSEITPGPHIAGAVVETNAGPNEGNVQTLNLPTVFTGNLRIAQDTVATSAAAATYQLDIDAAINSITGARAAIGAQMVSLQIQAANNNTASVNLTASESNIRDVNVGQTASSLAAAQILSTIGTSILANTQTLASAVEKLVQFASAH